MLVPGARVRLEGLQSVDKQQLNGCEGQIDSWDAERCRYIVVFNGSRLSFNSKNLIVLPPRPPAGEGATCVICLENGAARFAAVPCGHQCACKGCMDKLTAQGALLRCPTCRVPVSSFIQIFVPEPCTDGHGEAALKFLAEAKACNQAAEAARASAEQELAEAETKRKQAEQLLSEAGTFRAAAAEQLAEAEATLASAESERAAVESERAGWETARVEFDQRTRWGHSVHAAPEESNVDTAKCSSEGFDGGHPVTLVSDDHEVEPMRERLQPLNSESAASRAAADRGNESQVEAVQGSSSDCMPNTAAVSDQAAAAMTDEICAMPHSRKRSKEHEANEDVVLPGSPEGHVAMEPWEKCRRAWVEQLSLVISLD